MSTSTLVYAITPVLGIGLPQMMPEQSISVVLLIAPEYHDPLGYVVVWAFDGTAGSTVNAAASRSAKAAPAVIVLHFCCVADSLIAVPPRELHPA